MAIITVPHKKETPSQTSHCQLHHYLVVVIMVSFKLQHTIIFFQVDTVLQRFYGAFDLKQAIRWIHGWVIHLPIRCSSKPWSIRTNYNPAGVDVDIAILQLKLIVEVSLNIVFTLGVYWTTQCKRARICYNTTSNCEEIDIKLKLTLTKASAATASKDNPWRMLSVTTFFVVFSLPIRGP